MTTYERYKAAYWILRDLLSDLDSCTDPAVISSLDTAWIDLVNTGLVMDLRRACVALRRKNGLGQ